MLGAIRYQPNETVLHTDQTLLPRTRRAWASWNYQLPLDAEDGVPVTYDMTRLQGLEAPERFLVTLNRSDAIDPARVIRRLRYEHPVFDTDAILAQGLHDRISGVARTQTQNWGGCGKNLIAQMLCGSGSARIGKLGLRGSGFQPRKTRSSDPAQNSRRYQRCSRQFAW